MNFKQYLLNAEKVFTFRIKTLFPLEDQVMDLLEKALQKYRPKSITDPVKTILQTNPLGFTGVSQAEVFMTDVELTVPTTSALLEFDLRTMLGLGKANESLRVFSDLDPAEKAVADAEEAEKDQKETGPLLHNENYEEVEQAKFDDYFGGDYNARFLAVLKKAEEERKAKTKAGPTDPLNAHVRHADLPKSEPKEGSSSKD